MMTLRRATCVIAIGLIALEGCGFNTVRLERASTVSSAGAEAVNQTNAFLAKVKAEREEANIAIVASDETCAWPWKDNIIVLRGSGRQTIGGRRPLCLQPTEKYDEKLGDLRVAPVADLELKPTLATLDALSSYLDAVNAIVGRKDPDISGKIADAYGKALQAQSDITALVGADLNVIPELTKPQQDAITGLVKLVSALAVEQRKVSDLRRLVAAQNGPVLSVIADLKTSLDRWRRYSLEGDVQEASIPYVRMARDLGARRPIYRGFEARRTVIQQVVGQQQANQAIEQVTKAVMKGLDALAKAQADLFDGLSRNPHWTKKEREEAAKLNRQNVLNALHAIAAVAAAF
jgi:hypothetical protein